MPGIDGYVAARRIRHALRAQPPVLIALTGWGQEGSRRKALKAGFDFHAVKPVDIELLKNFIAQSRGRSGTAATDHQPAPAAPQG